MTSKPPTPTDKRWTVGELLEWTTQKFAEIGVDSPKTDAQYLLAHALQCSRMELYLQMHRLLEEDERAGFREMVRRRLKREPVAYIEGTRAFHALDLDLEVSSDVLIPRPETEHLVDWALELLQTSPAGARVLDVGTGSGAIALAIKKSRPDLDVFAVDISKAALQVAQRNAERLGLEIQFRPSDLLSTLISEKSHSFALVCANLPYIPSQDMADLQPEVRTYEPQLALDGGDDGLDAIRKMLAQTRWSEFLAADGHLLLEFGIGQASSIGELMRDAGFVDLQVRRDYAGIERVLRGSCFDYQSAENPNDTRVELDPDPRWQAEQVRAQRDEEPEQELSPKASVTVDASASIVPAADAAKSQPDS